MLLSFLKKGVENATIERFSDGGVVLAAVEKVGRRSLTGVFAHDHDGDFIGGTGEEFFALRDGCCELLVEGAIGVSDLLFLLVIEGGEVAFEKIDGDGGEPERGVIEGWIFGGGEEDLEATNIVTGEAGGVAEVDFEVAIGFHFNGLVEDKERARSFFRGSGNGPAGGFVGIDGVGERIAFLSKGRG